MKKNVICLLFQKFSINGQGQLLLGTAQRRKSKSAR